MGDKKNVPVVLEYLEALGRKIRQDPWDELGKSTWIKLKESIKAGKTEEALELVEYLLPEGKGLHNLFCDWVYSNLDYVAKNIGEEEVPKMLRYANMKISSVFYKNMATLTVKDQVLKYAETGRTNRSGPGELGNIEIREEEDRYVMTFDPCGSGGRLRRVGEIDGTPPRTEAPYNLGKTSKPYPWSWGKAGVPYYCSHCCVWGEQISIELLGYPVRITEFSEDPQKPCSFIFYKNPEHIPEEYFIRVGKVKDPSKFKPNPPTEGK